MRSFFVLLSMIGVACSASPPSGASSTEAAVSARAICDAPRGAPAVYCNGAVCEGATPICCLGRTGAIHCIARGEECRDIDWPVDRLECDGTEDCADPLVCCRGWNKSREATTATCRTSCLGSDASRKVCRASCECEAGETCVDSYCRPPE